MAKELCVLAYSGGLDTSVAIRWIAERYDVDVIALAIDVGEEKDYEGIRQKGEQVGAVEAIVVDAVDEFYSDFIRPALAANLMYEGKYPAFTALARPLLAKHQVRIAREKGATYVAHGCTGKGNDQVRFEVTYQALAPGLKCIAPAREWGMTREEEIDYAARHGIPVPSVRRIPTPPTPTSGAAPSSAAASRTPRSKPLTTPGSGPSARSTLPTSRPTSR